MSVLNAIEITRECLFISTSKQPKLINTLGMHTEVVMLLRKPRIPRSGNLCLSQTLFLVFSHNWNQPLGSCHILSGLTFL